MGPVEAVAQHLGLTLLTVISVALVIYLAWSMLHPERF
jgi:K+-transporting ATPase KdpF subunit